MAFIEPMHRNKPNITYLLPFSHLSIAISKSEFIFWEEGFH